MACGGRIKPMPTINAVLFDYGMVLSGPPNPAARARMEQLLDAPSDRFHEAYWEYRDAYDRGALSGEAYWRAVASYLGRTVAPSVLAELIAADTALWTQPNEPMIAWAAALQRAGIKTGILSNLGDAMELGIRGHFPWLQDFAHHTFSHHLGIAKPDPAIYRHAAEGLATPAQEILFIDDREENIRAAREAGMVAVQYPVREGGHAEFVAEMQRLGMGTLLSS
jgi:putative hydrolase of the HAD superfamily